MKARRPKPKSRKATHQKGYRRRVKDGTISPTIPVTARHTEALIRRAVRYGRLAPAQAKDVRESRQWKVQEVINVLDNLADEWP
jgi:hypothetical protein